VNPVKASEKIKVHSGRAETRAEKVILGAIVEDPFYTISELRLVLEESLFDSRISWWGVFRILRKNNLISRRARFRYARRMSRRA